MWTGELANSFPGSLSSLQREHGASSLMDKANTWVEIQYKMATREKQTQGEYVSMIKLSTADRYWRGTNKADVQTASSPCFSAQPQSGYINIIAQRLLAVTS